MGAAGLPAPYAWIAGLLVVVVLFSVYVAVTMPASMLGAGPGPVPAEPVPFRVTRSVIPVGEYRYDVTIQVERLAQQSSSVFIKDAFSPATVEEDSLNIENPLEYRSFSKESQHAVEIVLLKEFESAVITFQVVSETTPRFSGKAQSPSIGWEVQF